MKDLNLTDYPIFQQSLSTMAKTSTDKSNICLIQSDCQVINFDHAVGKWVRAEKCSATPASNDALFEDAEKDRLIFVEFKNRGRDDIQASELEKKIYESIIVLADILEKPMAFIRNHVEYILVYNDAKNKSIRFIEQSFSGFANDEFVDFGLDVFRKKHFVKDVHTYTVAEFQTKFLK